MYVARTEIDIEKKNIKLEYNQLQILAFSLNLNILHFGRGKLGYFLWPEEEENTLTVDIDELRLMFIANDVFPAKQKYFRAHSCPFFC